MGQEFNPDFETLANRLNKFMPQSDVAPLKILREGFNSIVFETAGGQVIKLFKTDGPTRRWLNETLLVNEIRHKLPALIPEVTMVFDVSFGTMHTAVGYARIAGRTLQQDDVATLPDDLLVRDLAGFLVALHSCQISSPRLAEMLPSHEDWESRMEQLRDSALRPLSMRLELSDYEAIELWWDLFLNDPRAKLVRPVLIHGDFWHENIMVDGDPLRLNGVLDFKEAHIGDPTQDFATLAHISPEFAMSVAESYIAQGGELDPDWRFRMARFWELREFFGIRYSVEANDQEELTNSIRKLCDGPIFNRKTRLDG